jgi:hypothetical protein
LLIGELHAEHRRRKRRPVISALIPLPRNHGMAIRTASALATHAIHQATALAFAFGREPCRPAISSGTTSGDGAHAAPCTVTVTRSTGP